MPPHVTTFGFDHGDPPEADRVYDVRGLKYHRREWDEKAKQIAHETGDDEHIAVGCKHGHTRSVHVAETIKSLRKGCTVTHLDKDKTSEPVPDHVRNETIHELMKRGVPEKRAIELAHKKSEPPTKA